MIGVIRGFIIKDEFYYKYIQKGEYIMREELIIKSDFKVLGIKKKSKAKALVNIAVGDVISVSYNFNGDARYAPEIRVLNKSKDCEAISMSATLFKRCIYVGYELERLG